MTDMPTKVHDNFQFTYWHIKKPGFQHSLSQLKDNDFGKYFFSKETSSLLKKPYRGVVPRPFALTGQTARSAARQLLAFKPLNLFDITAFFHVSLW